MDDTTTALREEKPEKYTESYVYTAEYNVVACWEFGVVYWVARYAIPTLSTPRASP